MTDLINKKILSHEKIVALNQEEIKDYFSQLNPVRNSPPQGLSGAFIPLEAKPLTGQSAGAISNGVKGGWEFLETHKITKEFKFEDFKEAMEFVNKVADVAEKEGHHPDIEIHYNKVNIILWTHFINGLSENDFIMAAKIDAI